MECKLYKETPTSYIYAVNRAFYLVIPKIRFKPNIEIIIDNDIADKLTLYSNTTSVGVIRVFAKNYFSDINDLVSMQKLKSIINADVSITKQILQKNNIEFTDEIVITTPFEDFKNWYINENLRHETSNSDDNNLSENQKMLLGLKALKEDFSGNSNSMNNSIANKSKDKKLSLSNGHSLLNYNYNDGFTNVLLISLITIIVSLSWITYMLNIIIK